MQTLEEILHTSQGLKQVRMEHPKREVKMHILKKNRTFVICEGIVSTMCKDPKYKVQNWRRKENEWW